MKAITYLRMSTQDQENSPERQKVQIEAHCKKRGYEIVARYEDLGLKGTDDSRPAFQRLLKDAQKGLFQFLVVDEQSRLARNDPVDFITDVVGPLRRAGVLIDTVAKGILDWSDLGQFIIGSVTQHASSAEVTTLSRRVVTELARKALKGDLVAGKPPYGYTQIWVDGKGTVVHKGKRTWARRPGGWEPTLEINEVEAEQVRWMFKAYVNEDLSLNGIAKDLHNRGILTPRGGVYWSRAHLRTILMNRVYLGEFVFNRVSVGSFHKLGWIGEGENRTGIALPKKTARKSTDSKEPYITKNSQEDWVIIPEHHPALIEQELWERAQEALKVNRKRCTPKPSRGDYTLSSTLLCTACKSFFVGNRDGSGKFYVCGGYSRNGPTHCSAFRVREQDAVGTVLQALVNHFRNPERRQLLRVQALKRKEQLNTGEGIERAKKILGELERKITKARQNILLLDADLVPGAQTQIRIWEKEKGVTEKELAELQVENPVEATENQITQMDKSMALIEEARLKGDLKGLRKGIRDCVVKVELEFRTEQKKVRKRHWWIGGKSYFHSGEVAQFSISQIKQGNQR